MRILPNQAPTSPASSRPAAVLSSALTRTPAFRALLPQLRLLGRVLKDLRPQTPRWPMPAAPGRSPRQGEGLVDGFAPFIRLGGYAACRVVDDCVPRGKGIPIRIS